jgi:enoyl-CoA hydratase/carnithine racemase
MTTASNVPPADEPTVLVARRGAALTITINREARRNAINPSVIAGIQQAIDTHAGDPTIRAIVLTGAGQKAFCAGADLAVGTDVFSPEGLDEPTTDFGRLARRMRTVGIPTIARVNGACVAGGMGLMSLCDLAIAADHARFGLPEVGVGVFAFQVLVHLRHMIGARHLNQLCLTGELIDARRAFDIGIANDVVPYDALDARIDALVMRLAAGSPVAIRRGKTAIAAMEALAFGDAMAFAEAQIGLASRSNDAREGLAAFNEKRRPRWAPEQS